MPDRRGAWYFLSLFNPVFLAAAFNGLAGEQAQREALLALADWSGVLTSRSGRLLLLLMATIVVVAVVLALYNRP